MFTKLALLKKWRWYLDSRLTREVMKGLWQGQGIKKLLSRWILLEYDNNLMKRRFKNWSYLSKPFVMVILMVLVLKTK